MYADYYSPADATKSSGLLHSSFKPEAAYMLYLGFKVDRGGMSNSLAA